MLQFFKVVLFRASFIHQHSVEFGVLSLVYHQGPELFVFSALLTSRDVSGIPRNSWALTQSFEDLLPHPLLIPFITFQSLQSPKVVWSTHNKSILTAWQSNIRFLFYSYTFRVKAARQHEKHSFVVVSCLAIVLLILGATGYNVTWLFWESRCPPLAFGKSMQFSWGTDGWKAKVRKDE